MRRISHWKKERGASDVRGVALQYLGLDCYARWVDAYVYPVLEGGWILILDRCGFLEQRYTEPTRHRAMMRAEHEIARQWGKPLACELPDNADREIGAAVMRNLPDPVPHADLAHFPHFWKPRRAIGPQREPRYMQLLTPAIRRLAKLPAGEAWREEVERSADRNDDGTKLDPEIVRLKNRIKRDEIELERLLHGEGKSAAELEADGGK